MRTSATCKTDLRQECQLTSELGNVAAAVRRVISFCRPHLPGGPQSRAVICALEMCTTEVLTNVIKHAYRGQGGLPIRIMVVAQPGKIEIHVSDEGLEMPAGTISAREIEFDCEDLANLPVGGFGWVLINSEMDQIRYRREGGTNHLAIVKDLQRCEPA